MPGSNSRPNVSEGYEVPLSYRGDRLSMYGDEQADAERDCRTRLARSNYQARTRTGRSRCATTTALNLYLCHLTTLSNAPILSCRPYGHTWYNTNKINNFLLKRSRTRSTSFILFFVSFIRPFLQYRPGDGILPYIDRLY